MLKSDILEFFRLRNPLSRVVIVQQIEDLHGSRHEERKRMYGQSDPFYIRDNSHSFPSRQMGKPDLHVFKNGRGIDALKLRTGAIEQADLFVLFERSLDSGN